MTKHAIISLSETLACELATRNTKIQVSVICPDTAKTNILASALNHFAQSSDAAQFEPESHAAFQGMNQAIEQGVSPTSLAEKVFHAITEEKFYILTNPDHKQLVQVRLDALLNDRSPVTALL